MKNRLKYLAYKGILVLCRVLPQRFLYWVALRLADLNWLLDRHGREAVRSNMERILPDASPERIDYETRWVFRNFGKYLSEFFRFRRFDETYLRKHVAIQGLEHIDAALAGGRGCIILSAHLSNWELGAAGLCKLHGYPVNVVAESHTYKKADELFMRERRHMNIKVIPAKTAGRAVLRRLQNNEIVCILGDRDPTSAGVTVDFFGHPCRFPQGPARFAIATGAPVVPGFVLRRTNDSFTLTFSEPIEPPARGDREEAVRTLTQRYARTIEDAIRWHPEEWTVFYSVWDEEWVA